MLQVIALARPRRMGVARRADDGDRPRAVGVCCGHSGCCCGGNSFRVSALMRAVKF
jgi:hypothetical protein